MSRFPPLICSIGIFLTCKHILREWLFIYSVLLVPASSCNWGWTADSQICAMHGSEGIKTLHSTILTLAMGLWHPISSAISSAIGASPMDIYESINMLERVRCCFFGLLSFNSMIIESLQVKDNK